MNYTICLDYNSPNYNPANLSLNGFSVYSDYDNFTTPISTGIPASLLFPPPNGTCPFSVLGIPNGATQILIVDQCIDPQQIASIFSPANIAAENIIIECCYALIDIDPSCNDFCSDCGIGFDSYALNTTGSIIAGNLTSSCGTVTDYVIGWYLNGSTSPSFTSGFGNQFGHPFTHPLTGNSSPLVAAGNWEGIIHDVIINGTHYTNLASGSGVGSPIPFQSCFGTVVAEPFTCDNGQFPITPTNQYSHQKSFTSVANGAIPQPVSFTYQLSPNIKYFAYLFSGFNIWDEVEIKFISGTPNITTNPALYSNPIYLEKIRIGSNAPTPWLLSSTNNINGNSPGPTPPGTATYTNGINNAWPKNSPSYFNFQRTLTLTNLETSSNPSLPDSLIITISPNPTNSSTNWYLEMQCLEDFDCTNCTFDNDPPFIISDIDLQRPTGNPCIQQRLAITASVCTSSSDLAGYFSYISMANANSPIQEAYPNSTYLGISGDTTCGQGYGYGTTCNPPTPGSIITFSKTNIAANGFASNGSPLGKIYMTFNNYSDYSQYKFGFITQESFLTSNIGPYTPNCNVKGYYSGYILSVPFQALNANCGDNTTTLTFNIHRSAYANITYVENPGTNFWSITIPMPECLDCMSFLNCTNCYTDSNGYTALINLFNDSSFTQPGNQITYTNNNGSRYMAPTGVRYLTVNITPSVTGSIPYTSGIKQMRIHRYMTETIPFVPSATSPTGWSNLPLLGNTPCPGWSGSLGSGSLYNTGYDATYGIGYTGNYYNVDYIFHNVTASANTMNNDFSLYTKVTDNSGDIASSPLLIYTYSQSIVTVHQPQFFTGGSPNLTIQPF